jgi:hypothetical protein
MNPSTSQYVNYTVNGLYDGFINSKRTMQYSDTDWVDEISRTVFLATITCRSRMPTIVHTTMFSLTVTRRTTVYCVYTDFQSYSARMNSSYKVNKMISVGEKFTLSYTRQVDSAPMRMH